MSNDLYSYNCHSTSMVNNDVSCYRYDYRFAINSCGPHRFHQLRVTSVLVSHHLVWWVFLFASPRTWLYFGRSWGGGATPCFPWICFQFGGPFSLLNSPVELYPPRLVHTVITAVNLIQVASIPTTRVFISLTGRCSVIV